ncbi:MAG: PilZ domain-containing protein [Desulfobacterales bacterium]
MMIKHGGSSENRFQRTAAREKRVHVRVTCAEDTHFSADRRLFEGTILNVSKGGIYIRTQGRFTVGQEVIVAGSFDDSGSEIKRYGKIVRSDGKGIAVQFITKNLLWRP